MPKLKQSYASESINQLRHLTQRQHIILTGRAVTGIWAALRAWGMQDEVILLPANTCYTVWGAVLKSVNRPLLVDVDRHTANLTVAGLEEHIGAHPAVVIPCH